MRMAFFGDMFLDAFQRVFQVKINPESGCPVYVLDGAPEQFPGGVGNAARPLEHFGVEAIVFHGHEHSRPMVKTRLIFQGRQVARIDTPALSAPGCDQVMAAELCKIEDLAAIVVSDYSAGFVTDRSLAVLLDHARSRLIPIVVDAKRILRGVDYSGENVVLKPNAAEASQMAGVEDPAKAAAELASQLDCHCVVTRGASPPAYASCAEGVSRELEPISFPDRPFQCSGAGDWFASFLAFDLARGRAIGQAVAFAYRAAAAAGLFPPFRQPVLPREVEAIAFPHRLKLLADRAELLQWCRHRAGGRVVVTNGCFDLFHAGHAANLEECRRQGDQLLVLVNSDRSVQSLKGPGKPHVELGDRLRVLAGLECVSAVAVFDQPTPAEILGDCVQAMGRPFAVLAKGPEYAAADVAGLDSAEAFFSTSSYPCRSSDLAAKIRSSV